MMLFQVMKNDTVVIAFVHSPLGPQQLQNKEEELRMITVLWAVVGRYHYRGACWLHPLLVCRRKVFLKHWYSSTKPNRVPYSSNINDNIKSHRMQAVPLHDACHRDESLVKVCFMLNFTVCCLRPEN
jgi:hypothetical protein